MRNMYDFGSWNSIWSGIVAGALGWVAGSPLIHGTPPSILLNIRCCYFHSLLISAARGVFLLTPSTFPFIWFHIRFLWPSCEPASFRDLLSSFATNSLMTIQTAATSHWPKSGKLAIAFGILAIKCSRTHEESEFHFGMAIAWKSLHPSYVTRSCPESTGVIPTTVSPWAYVLSLLLSPTKSNSSYFLMSFIITFIQ